jgi:hypothetical protein
MPSVLVTLMTGSEDLPTDILGRRARARFIRSITSATSSHRWSCTGPSCDRLAVAGDDHGFAALDRPDQAGQVGLGLVCCHHRPNLV